ncbi:single-stranded DNA-binding protein [Nocardioides sp. DS6]|uniref:Single-stranded DNA-binding protein n=1 Tax=Nocardioides eburneus TaxID=3231482 RepID=A0ABV3T283_9ACTN
MPATAGENTHEEILMTESMITLQGFVGAEPVLRIAGGHPVANFRVACTPRRLNRTTGAWADAPTQWFTVNAWRVLGENVARSLRKGDAVVVHGRLSARSYTNKDGLEVNTFEVEASVVGHDLNRGLTHLIKNDRRGAVELPGRGFGREAARDAVEAGDDREAALAQAQADWGGLPLDEPPGFEAPVGPAPERSEAEEGAPASAA